MASGAVYQAAEKPQPHADPNRDRRGAFLFLM